MKEFQGTSSSKGFLSVVIPVSGAILLIFGGYEIIERAYLRSMAPNILYYTHLIRGIGASLLVAYLVYRSLLQRAISPLQSSYIFDEIEIPNDKDIYIHPKSVEWLISLRWIAFSICLLALLLGVYLYPVVLERETHLPLTFLVILIGITNGIYGKIKGKIQPLRNISIQMIGDLFILTGLLHFSGGGENPLFMAYYFHIILASILLPKRWVYIIAFLIIFLFGVLLLLEYSEFLPHYTLLVFPHYSINQEGHLRHASHNLPFITSVWLVFCLTLFFITYFATSIVELLRKEMKDAKDKSALLLQSSKLATLGEMVGYLSHEINNPMSIINLHIKKLLMSSSLKEKEKEKDKLLKVDKQIQRISQVIQSLLRIVRKRDSQKQPIQLENSLRSILSLIHPLFSGKSIRLKFHYKVKNKPIWGNPIEIEQILLNIIQNSMDAIGEKGEISILLDSPSPQWVVLEIRDNGRGIPEDQIPKIFDSFFTTKPKGTGLGLAIVKMLVENHNGTIEVESQWGKGTTFRLKFPSFQSGDSKYEDS